ncbi:16S rRNA (guanine(966)-N(2))-methyltransferase RsmD [Thermoleptolyngbya sp. C42_A2020_037]|uniref:16S rRNA (guanine(966)-N(2))-methyltransferase RsmD n=1 Tax=Thermoleptolyngbya sp. C42_A2020_037 TaxID=2747799 RepID=UPI0019F8DE20|nr:16S rRNA (guanine(966)-N(2))-methyltransferase RsmD [Thermoleptolyngbya sp. C42_A2020_037]MBF2084525.1 16S rRNA (guanine(966)-N(2))-methyltransferase RsmD [Thermoleptolyngbya sp. C42_A2020_037]
MSLRIYGNRLIKTLPGGDTRPTPSRVRQALFNIWQGEIEGCRWLDLCSGSGSMGAEALCRGAALVVGIEQSGRAAAVIAENWQTVAKPNQQFRLLRGDVRQMLPKLSGQRFDRIYFDPPYASELYEPVLEAIARHQLLAPDGELAVEHGGDRFSETALATLLPRIAPLTPRRKKVYGNTALMFFGWQNEGLA